MKSLVIVFTFLAILSCKKEENLNCTQVQFNQSFVADVGTEYCIDDNNSIVIDSIANQLCPCDVVCVWEGEYLLKMSITADGKSYKYDMGTSVLTPDAQPFNDFKIDFLSITPFKCNSNIQKDYRVNIILKKS